MREFFLMSAALMALVLAGAQGDSATMPTDPPALPGLFDPFGQSSAPVGARPEPTQMTAQLLAAAL